MGYQAFGKVVRKNLFAGSLPFFNGIKFSGELVKRLCKSATVIYLIFMRANPRLDFRRLPGPVFDECGLIFPNSGW